MMALIKVFIKDCFYKNSSLFSVVHDSWVEGFGLVQGPGFSVVLGSGVVTRGHNKQDLPACK